MNAKTKGREGGYNCVVCIKQVPDTKKVWSILLNLITLASKLRSDLILPIVTIE